MSEEDLSTPQSLFIKYEHSDGLFVAQRLGACKSEKKKKIPVSTMSTQKVNFP